MSTGSTARQPTAPREHGPPGPRGVSERTAGRFAAVSDPQPDAIDAADERARREAAALLRGLNDDQRAGGHLRRRHPAHPGRRRLGQDPGAHPPHRLPGGHRRRGPRRGCWRSPSPARRPPSCASVSAASACATACRPAPSTPSRGPSSASAGRSGGSADRSCWTARSASWPASARARDRTTPAGRGGGDRVGVGPPAWSPRSTRAAASRAHRAPPVDPTRWRRSTAGTSRPEAPPPGRLRRPPAAGRPGPRGRPGLRRRPSVAVPPPVRRRVPGRQPTPASSCCRRGWARSPTLCVVGDPNQAIYAWNGADARYLVDFDALRRRRRRR